MMAVVDSLVTEIENQRDFSGKNVSVVPSEEYNGRESFFNHRSQVLPDSLDHIEAILKAHTWSQTISKKQRYSAILCKNRSGR
ncbi:hypothetical protein [Rhodohalobacter sp.]|uniref:hypothetical protein n=1 Tax=Rhodohalobacter sp. TaxID=1974210 RepID=UPI002ACD9133|nr:hypothetical protein [Rhodohalobacter sp.]MDZ7756061.1 hypothetical protein [Rhodohalobacter sp.]